jgi:hypothetical protein
MAFRIEARIGAILALAAVLGSAQEVQVRHTHLRHGGYGQLQVSQDSLRFVETGKGKKHSRNWKYDDIQQLELTLETLRLLTYEDQKWKFGRDREYLFDHLPEGFAQTVYALWRDRLDQRFTASLPDKNVQVAWEIPAKLLGKGSQGTVRIGSDRIVYETEAPAESRTWRFLDIENIATAGPFDLSIVTREHHGTFNNGSREFRFQLKQALPEERYNELWRNLNLQTQSDLIRTSQPGGHEHP